MPINSARDLVAEHEGCTLVAIPDTGNTWSIGYGRNDGTIKKGQTCTQAEADAWFTFDLAVATQRAMAAITLPYWDKLNEPRKATLIDMSYELGGAGIMGFTKMLQAIRAEDWKTAAMEGYKSLWAEQVPHRAAEDMLILVTGEWPEGAGNA